jgi:peptide/nickel transport system substrate-binding protein
MNLPFAPDGATRQRMSRRRALQWLAGGAGTVFVAACSVAAPPSQSAVTVAPPVAPSPTMSAVSAPQSSAAKPRRGGTLRSGMTGNITTLDGTFTGVNQYETVWLIYDRLTAYDLNLQPQPMLAESWEMTDDHTQVKVNLRKGVQFHSGREFTSDDVKWNFQRIADPKAGAGSFANMSKWFSIETPDKYTVVLKSDKPRPAMFDLFEYINMLDRVTMEGPDARTKAVGTGPFTFVEWASGDHFTLAANKNYWLSGRPYLDGIIVSTLGDAQSMVGQLEAGALDVIRTPPTRDLVRLRSNPSYQAIIHLGSGQAYGVAAEVEYPPLDNKLVRQALNFAINRARFVDTFLSGLGSPESLPWLPSSPAYDAAKNQAYTFDLARAKSLLEQAGATNIELDILTNSATPEFLTFAQAYQSDLATIGVKLNIKSLEGAALTDQLNNRKYRGLYTSTFGFGQLEPVTKFLNGRDTDPSSNNEGFKSDAYSQLIDAASVEPDLSKRKQLYGQLNDLLLDESFVMFIAPQPPTLLARAQVQGVEHTLHQGFWYANTWLTA